MSPKKYNQLDLKIRLLTKATTIASSFLLGSLLIMVLVSLNLAYAQIPNNGDDLNQTAVPEFDFNNVVDKSMVVLLNFTALNKAQFVDVDVSYGPPHSNIGNPPLLRVQIYDYNGAIIQQFNYWHPLFALEFQEEDSKEYLKILPNAVGRFVFPFDPNAALMKISYLYHEGANNTRAEEVISVDLGSPVLSFCDQFPKDPDCRGSDLAVVDVSTDNGQQQLPIPVGSSVDVTVQTTVTNNGPDKPIDATLSRRTITGPPASDGGGGAVIVTPAAGANPNENGATITTITSLSERQQQHDQTYTIECWEPGKYNIIFESEIVPLSAAVVDDNQPNNKGQMNLEVDCGEIDVCPPPPEPLGVSIEANATEDGSPPSTVEFRAITEGGTQPHKYRWNFDDDGNNNSNNNNYVKGGQLMTHQFARLGQYNVIVTVTDSANGSRCQTASDNIIVTISDKEPPQPIYPSDIIAEATGPEGAIVTFTVTATDNVDGSVPVQCTPRSGDTFGIRTTTVNCRATDSSGNTGYGRFTVTVRDTTPPTLIPPQSKTVEASGPSTPVEYPPATATDIVDPSPTVTCPPPSSPITITGVGSQVVECEAKDKSGNSAKDDFTVTVQDTRPPIIFVPAPITVEASGPSTPVPYPSATATDIVDPSPTVTCPPPSSPITITGVGSQVVECEAKDKSGNSAKDDFTVTVQDTTAPAIIVLYNGIDVEDGGTISVNATGPEGIRHNAIFKRLEISATDIVDGPVAEEGCTNAVFTEPNFPVGQTKMQCSASDAAGNTETKSFTIVVTYTPPPPPPPPPPPQAPCPEENQDRVFEPDDPGDPCVPDPNNCSDGSDNDGDDLIDGNDPDCTPPPPAALAAPPTCPPGTGPDVDDDEKCVPIPGAEGEDGVAVQGGEDGEDGVAVQGGEDGEDGVAVQGGEDGEDGVAVQGGEDGEDGGED